MYLQSLGITALSLVSAGPLLIAYVRLSNEKRKPRCRRCGGRMFATTAKWPADQWLNAGKDLEPVNFQGADGNVYFDASPVGRAGSLPSYHIDARIQIWYACVDCRTCFLGQRYASEHVFTAHDRALFERQKTLLMQDSRALNR